MSVWWVYDAIVHFEMLLVDRAFAVGCRIECTTLQHGNPVWGKRKQSFLEHNVKPHTSGKTHHKLMEMANIELRLHHVCSSSDVDLWGYIFLGQRHII